MDLSMRFGFPDEWQAFSKRHGRFFATFTHLQGALNTSLFRTVKETDLPDKMVLFLGRLCFEDFMEILLLAGNGYGFGALKLVRGMYERAVIASYLSENRGETDYFINYVPVEELKALRVWTEAFPESEHGRELLEKARVRYEEVKDLYTGRKSWSSLDFVSMAKKTGPLGKLLGECYYAPLSHAHGTAKSVVARLAWSEQKGFEFVAEAQHEQADQAFLQAHKILLYILGIQEDHFHPDGHAEALSRCTADFVTIWNKVPRPDSDGPPAP